MHHARYIGTRLDKIFTVVGGGIIVMLTLLFACSKTWKEFLKLIGNPHDNMD